jgi:hypothetical protein
MSDLLKGLGPGARSLVAERAFRTGELAAVDAAPYIIEDVGLGRAIELAPLRAVVAWAMSRRKPGESDAWLAPRVHATLRLTRREAADRRIWSYVAAVALPDYTRLRWRDPIDRKAPVAIDRFVGDAATNALSRLWWAAELTRNGGDYGPTVRMLSGPWFAPAWFKLDVLDHRAAAQAVVDIIGAAGKETTSADRGWVVARAVDVALRTLSVDSLAPDPGPDAEAVREWCNERVDETVMIKRLPAGPDEPPVPEAYVAAMRAVLGQLAEQAGVKAATTGRRARKAS